MLKISPATISSLFFILFTLLPVGYSIEFTEEEKVELTNYHNAFRGEISYVESMPALIWDDYIGGSASATAEVYACKRSVSNESYRQYPDYEYFNEKFATMGEIIWYSSAKSSTEKVANGMKNFGSNTYNRAKAWRFGCGYGICEDDIFKYYYVCQYFTCPVRGESPYVTSTENCTTCAAVGLQCGEYTNSCGKKVTCNSCKTSEKCENNKCVCYPKTECDDSICGVASDGCGGTIQCGDCKHPGQECNELGKCICVNRTTCISAGKECGAFDDGCGGNLSCGTCYGESYCVDNMCHKCGHIRTCEEYNISCGSIDSGCGYRVDCGTCTKGNTCVMGECVMSGSFGSAPNAILTLAILAILMMLMF